MLSDVLDKIEDPKHRTWYESADEVSTPQASDIPGCSPGSAELLKGWDDDEKSMGTLPRLPSTPQKSSLFIDLSNDEEEGEGIDATVDEIIQKINIPFDPKEWKKKKEGEEEGINTDAADTEMDQMLKMESSSCAASSVSSVIHDAQPIAQSVDIGTWHNDIILARSLQGGGSMFAFLNDLPNAEKAMVDFLFYDPYEEEKEIPADLSDSAAAERNELLKESLTGNLVITLLVEYNFLCRYLFQLAESVLQLRTYNYI